MWLLIDIGNSAAKVGLWEEGGGMVRTARLDSADTLSRWLDGVGVTAAGGVCVVPERATAWAEAVLVATGKRLHLFDTTSRLPVSISYRTPATLGTDRIAAVCGGWVKYGVHGQRGVLVVDAGTAANIEVIRASGDYVGGVIAPGPELLRRALREGTAQLPVVALEAPLVRLGKSTDEAVRAGLMYGFLAAMEGLVRGLRADEASEMTLVLTGGWGSWLSDRLELDHHLEVDLVLEGVAALLRVRHGDP